MLKAIIFDLNHTLVDNSWADSVISSGRWDAVDGLIPLFETFDGIQDVISLIDEMGLKKAIVTRNPKTYSLRVLEHFGWKFDCVVSAVDTIQDDSQELPFTEVLNVLGVDSKEAIFVSDDENDCKISEALGLEHYRADWNDLTPSSYYYSTLLRVGCFIASFIDERNNCGPYQAFHHGMICSRGWEKEKNHYTALKWFLISAEQGYCRAQNLLGAFHTKGNGGVEQNHTKAVEWYLKAAKQGYISAQCNLAGCYMEGRGVEKSDVEAFYWYLKGAEQGDSICQYHVANCYTNGFGVEKDEVKGFDYYLKAAEHGHIEAQECLAECYNLGRGVENNLAKYSAWHSRAVKKNNERNFEIRLILAEGQNPSCESMFNLAKHYSDGCGVEKDDTKAFEWFLKAAEQDDADAQYIVGVRYANSCGVEKDEVKAFEWFLKAAEQGKAVSQYMVGVRYDNGLGVEKDEVKAFEWFLKAAEQGKADAQYKVGVRYSNGRGVEKDEVKAFEWFLKAAEQDDADAQYIIGVHYSDGRGVAKDDTKAFEWFLKAAEQDNYIAQEKVSGLYAAGVGVKKNKTKADEWRTKAELKVSDKRYLARGRLIESIFGAKN